MTSLELIKAVGDKPFLLIDAAQNMEWEVVVIDEFHHATRYLKYNSWNLNSKPISVYLNREFTFEFFDTKDDGLIAKNKLCSCDTFSVLMVTGCRCGGN